MMLQRGEGKSQVGMPDAANATSLAYRGVCATMTAETELLTVNKNNARPSTCMYFIAVWSATL